jgi:hypothetical protein
MEFWDRNWRIIDVQGMEFWDSFSVGFIVNTYG